jgi:hypothetical protein
MTVVNSWHFSSGNCRADPLQNFSALHPAVALQLPDEKCKLWQNGTATLGRSAFCWQRFEICGLGRLSAGAALKSALT